MLMHNIASKSESWVFSVFKSICYIVQFNVITPRDFRHIHDTVREKYRLSGVVYTIRATIFFFLQIGLSYLMIFSI